MRLFFLLAPLFFQQQEAPFKPFSEFEIIIDYKFKQRPGVDRYKLDFSQTLDDMHKNQFATLPYLIVNFKVNKLSDEEVKVHAENNLGHTVYSKKASLETLIKIDVGYTDDVKDRVTPHEFFINFLSKNKKLTSVIHMIILEDGTFIINEETRGKF